MWAGSQSAMWRTRRPSPSKPSADGGTTGLTRRAAASKLLVTADEGGSNGYRIRVWKVGWLGWPKERLDITVCRYPPETSKWNKIEHKMLSFITMKWRGRPRVSFRPITESTSATTTHSRVAAPSARPELLRDGPQAQRQGGRGGAAHTTRLPRRLEPHDRSHRMNPAFMSAAGRALNGQCGVGSVPRGVSLWAGSGSLRARGTTVATTRPSAPGLRGGPRGWRSRAARRHEQSRRGGGGRR